MENNQIERQLEKIEKRIDEQEKRRKLQTKLDIIAIIIFGLDFLGVVLINLLGIGA